MSEYNLDQYNSTGLVDDQISSASGVTYAPKPNYPPNKLTRLPRVDGYPSHPSEHPRYAPDDAPTYDDLEYLGYVHSYEDNRYEDNRYEASSFSSEEDLPPIDDCVDEEYERIERLIAEQDAREYDEYLNSCDFPEPEPDEYPSPTLTRRDNKFSRRF